MPKYSENAIHNQGVAHTMSHDNLHIRCKSFGPSQANIVMDLLKNHHKTCKRIFIDVRGIHAPANTVADTFKSQLTLSSVSPAQVFFKGSEGFGLAINGNRVLVQSAQPKENAEPKKHVCCGKCKHCHCHDHHAN